MIKFKIESDLHKEYEWVISIFAKYIGFDCAFVNEEEDILIAEHGLGDIQISHFFKNIFISGDYQFKSYFKKEPLHYSASGKPDYLSTCFYLLSYLQEYTDYVPDKYDRFPYEISLQKYFNCIEENLVAKYFDALYESTPKLKSLVQKKIHKTKFFLTHDIDSVYGALGNNYKYLLKNGKIGTLLQLIFNHYMKTPDYLLLDKIMDIEDVYDVKSTFFWIVNYGMGNPKIKNADYHIDNKKIKDVRENIFKRGNTNALHKSVSTETHAKEFQKLGDHLLEVNRNHYLQIELPGGFNGMENSEVKIDSTMGFPETIGFRNNYGLPIHPYKLKGKWAYNFIEVPLTIMDTTLKYYNNNNSTQARNIVLNFLEKNKTDAVMTILWHNNYFFDHRDKGWIDLYKDVLQFIKENSLSAASPIQLLEEFK
ncbi:MAG: hypothetical protein H7Y00_10975 [Fimbriimonadaceae bacterium]|nr:hypothetical protein [Chitinophagales bacterium]